MVPDTPSADELRLARLVRAHDRWRGRAVFNLLPSENTISPRARRLLSSDLAGRYTLPMKVELLGETVDNSYAGTRYTDQVQDLADSAARRIFRAEFATTRPLSGHVAAMAVLAPLVPRGSTVMAIPPERGGYDGYGSGYLPELFGFTLRPLPAELAGNAVDEEAAVAAIRHERPAAVVLGQSFFLFPYPLTAIAEEAHRVGALVLYDGSHVMGLVAGGAFQDPLREGADVLYGSTHKSFPGPQGGVILSNREDLFRPVDAGLVWRTMDNAHWNRVAGVAQTLLELERWGGEYARTTILNAQALAAALASEGFPVAAAENGYTASHQVILEGAELVRRYRLGPVALARRWERAGLVADLVGRLGTAEVTRLGLQPQEMGHLASLLARSGLRNERVGPEVRRWRREFTQLRYG